MWKIRIDLDSNNPEKVIVTALFVSDDTFSYSEVMLIQDFKLESFVQNAISKRNKFMSDQVRVREIAKTLSQDILNALNKEDGIEGLPLSVIADRGVIQCVKYVEPIINELIKEV